LSGEYRQHVQWGLLHVRGIRWGRQATWRTTAQIVVLVGVYYLVAEAGLSAGALAGNVTPVWPPTGVALAVLVLFGRRLWPGVALGALLVNGLSAVPWVVACGMAAGNTLEAVIGASLLGLVPGFRPSLERVSDVVAAAVLAAGLATAVSASVGVASLALGDVIAPGAFWATWGVWWVGDALGALVVGSTILIWARPRHFGVSTRARLGGVITVVVLAGVSLVAFSGPPHRVYMVFPLLILAALLLRQPGATAATLVVSGIAIALTVEHVGPFVTGTTTHSLWILDTFLAVVALTTLMLAAVVDERDGARREALMLVGAIDRELAAASRLAAIVESSGDAIIGKTLSGAITSWNTGAEHMYGYTAREIVGRNISLLIPPHRAGELSEIVERVGRGERVEHFETERVGKDGHILDVSVTVSPVRDTAGAIVGASTVARNISDQKLALRDLRTSEARKRAILESALDCVVTMDSEGRILEFNPAAEHTFGYSKAAVIGQELAQVIIPPSLRDAHRAGLAQCLARSDGNPVGRRLQMTAMRADGSEFPVELAITQVDLPGPPIFTGYLRDVTEPVRAERELTHRALHDALTGLPNRVLLIDRLRVALERAQRSQSMVAVVFVDVDWFKDVNTAHGHAGGDDLLSEVAGRLAGSVRGADTVARFGGDEFVVVSEGVAHFADNLAARLRHSMAAPCIVGGTEVPITVSMGVAVGGGTDGPDALLRDADIALLHAKALGKNRTEFYTDALRATSQDRLSAIADLRRAVDRHEFSLRFQPVQRLDGTGIIGAEALLRWEHPEKGTVLPAEFIGLAEETGLIIPIGRWVIEESCRRLARWRAVAPELSVSVNISASQLSALNLNDVVQDALTATGLEPARLVLEITEGILMDDVAFYSAALGAIRKTGAKIAIDDFGTGYSSLAYLEQFPVDVLKIDQCFIAGLPSDAYHRAVVRAVVAIGRALNLSVVAEGVESQVQAEALLRLGCHDVQGYHFDRPLTDEDFQAAVAFAATPALKRS
jgi:diguanylate cyclase (GGDEF)-like protein/PAS domain S-box-containing protein